MWPFSKSESESEKWLVDQEKNELTHCELWVQALNSRHYNRYLALLDVTKITVAGLSGLVLFLYLPTGVGNKIFLQFAPSLLTALVSFLENTIERSCSQPIPTPDQLQERLLPELSETKSDSYCTSMPKKACHLVNELILPATCGFFASAHSIWTGISTSAITSGGFARLFNLYHNRRVMPQKIMSHEEEEEQTHPYSLFAANLAIKIQNTGEPIKILEGTQEQIKDLADRTKRSEKKSSNDVLSPPDSLGGPPSTDQIDRSKNSRKFI